MTAVLTALVYRDVPGHAGGLSTTGETYLYEHPHLPLYQSISIFTNVPCKGDWIAFSMGLTNRRVLTIVPGYTGNVCSIWSAFLLLHWRCRSKGHASSQGGDPWSPPSGHLGNVEGDSSNAQIICGEKRHFQLVVDQYFCKIQQKIVTKVM